MTSERPSPSHIREVDPYDHPTVIHTFPNQTEQVYSNLLAFPYLEGPSFQFGKATRTHKETVNWIKRSVQAGRPWFACQDEIGPAENCVPPDAQDPEHAETLREALWGNLMAGGSGAEWIFAYDTFPRQPAKHLDIACENWRPWQNLWDRTFVALDFFHRHLPFTQMKSDDKLVEAGAAWCLAKPEEVYAIYLFGGKETKLQLPAGAFTTHWFKPLTGGELIPGGILTGPGAVALGKPPAAPETGLGGGRAQTA